MTRLRWLLAAVTFVGTLLLLEGAAHLLPLPDGAPDPEASKWRIGSAELGWQLRPGFRGEAYDAQRAVAADGLFEIDSRQLAAEPERPLVLALGDSRTFGNGVAVEDTWVEELDRRLPEAVVVNLGVPGYSVVQGVAVLEEKLAQWQGRVVAVVMGFGFNDRRYAAMDGPDDAVVFARRVQASRQSGMARSRLIRLLQGRWRARVVQPPLDLRTRLPRVTPQRFHSELARAVELCADQEVAVVLLAMPDHPAMVAPLEMGELAAEAGDVTIAIEELSRAVAQDDVFSDAARLALSRALRRSEDPESGLEADRVAWSDRWLESESGGYPLSSFRGYRAAMAIAGAVTLDVSGELAEPELFFDFVHFKEAGHARVAERVAGLLRDLAPVTAGSERDR